MDLASLNDILQLLTDTLAAQAGLSLPFSAQGFSSRFI